MGLLSLFCCSSALQLFVSLLSNRDPPLADIAVSNAASEVVEFKSLASSHCQHSPACWPLLSKKNSTSSVKRLCFGDRCKKAGGSTLQGCLKGAVTETCNLAMTMKEAKPFEIPGERGNTMHVTRVRDSGEHAISSFKHEG
jgi:hypothetical protein